MLTSGVAIFTAIRSSSDLTRRYLLSLTAHESSPSIVKLVTSRECRGGSALIFRRVWLTVALCIAVCTLPGVQPATAYKLNGCSYQFGGAQWVKFYSVSAYNQDRTTEAAANWNSQQNAIDWQFSQSGVYPTNVQVADGSYSGAWWGLTSATCINGHYASDRNDIQLNDRTMNADGLGIRDRRWIVIHELGHAGGLDHNSLGCGNSIMRDDACVYSSGFSSPPWWDDRNGFNAIYL